MKKNFLFFILALCSWQMAGAQQEKHKIALFVPLYLDSAFDQSGNFKYEKTGGRFYNAGLDFYFGAQQALDSLKSRNAELEVFVYDTKGREPLNDILARPELDHLALIIGQTNGTETKLLAEAASKRKIPFISATFPNDAGVFNNPDFVILNSTLQSHVEGIYHFLQRYNSQDRIVVFRKPGSQEDQLKNYLTDYAKLTEGPALNLKFVDLPANFNQQTIAASLDSTRKNVCIAGSLDENFGIRLAQGLAMINKTYPVRLIGMPTWDHINFARMNDLEIIYTSPFFYNRSSALETQLANEYNSRMSAKPSDLFFLGYETTLRFSLLLLDTGSDLGSNLTRKGNTIFTQFDIQPVFKDRSNMNLDLFENEHLYFIKVLGGVKNVIY